jgi:hypothetical protein
LEKENKSVPIEKGAIMKKSVWLLSLLAIAMTLPARAEFISCGTQEGLPDLISQKGLTAISTGSNQGA